MRRLMVLFVLLGAMAAGLGCRHVGGMNDVYHHPDNAIVNTGSGNPYRATGAPIPSEAVPEKMPAPIPVPDANPGK